MFISVKFIIFICGLSKKITFAFLVQKQWYEFIRIKHF